MSITDIIIIKEALKKLLNMPLQFLKYNNNTTNAAVVISIKDWEKITQINQDINLIVVPEITGKTRLKPSDY